MFVVLALSLGLRDTEENAAVIIVDGELLRSADTVGAPAAHGQPLPDGVEGRVIEVRSEWAHFAMSDGTAGWLPTAAVASVVAQPEN